MLALNDGDKLDTIIAWTDESGNGRHWGSTEPTEEPTFKTNIKNGKPAILFDGVRDEIIPANTLNLNSFISASAFTVFQVVSVLQDIPADSDFNGYPLIFGRDWWGTYVGNTNTLYGYHWDGGAKYDYVGPVAKNAWYIFMFRYDGTKQYVSINNGAEVEVAAAAVGSLAIQPLIGGDDLSHFVNFYSGDIIFRNQALSPTDIAAEYAYLNQKYAVY